MGFGKIQYWGLNPACELPDKSFSNILLLDHGDLRYVFRNIPTSSVQLFTIYERDIRIVSRHMVKLAILFLIKNNKNLSEQIELAHDYAELHGNVRICEQSANTLVAASLIASNVIVPSKKLSEEHRAVSDQLANILDLSLLLQRDKDDLFNIFKEFQKVEDYQYDSLAERLKVHYGERYNFNHSVCLWDYHFNLDKYMPYVNEVFYKSFRTDGVAHLRPYFRLPEYFGGSDI